MTDAQLMSERCKCCDRHFDRPGFFDDCLDKHPAPTIPQQIAEAIERDICGRRGLRQEWEQIDEDVRRDIRDEWAKLIGGSMLEVP